MYHGPLQQSNDRNPLRVLLTKHFPSFCSDEGQIMFHPLEKSHSIIKQGNIDLILLDIGLPDGSGLDLIPDIEQMEPQPQIIIFSALDVSEEYISRVDTVLINSETNTEKLLKVLLGTIK